jgi:hypothetical protein
MILTELIRRVRNELGDQAKPLRALMQGDGVTVWFNLPTPKINQTGFEVSIDGTTVDPSQYTVDTTDGQIIMNTPVPDGSILLVQGTSFGMFSDQDLLDPMRDAIIFHCFNRTIQERRRNVNGFFTYRDMPITLTNLPAEEELPIVILSTTNAQWTLINDASLDVNVQTAESTSIDRGARYRQLMGQIEANTERYKELCGVMNVGPWKMETLNLRRTSYTNNRLIPLYVPREYDDVRYPTRMLPPIDSRYRDNSGIPSSLFYGAGI